ncbi:MAG: glycosyltransferase [Chlamydiales bacterium]|nr:glycosyltransferase family 4 protein [Chlamydiales bacterium]NCF70360.1 glycosyltransferase [Chlamydiales bacterium]
MYKKVYFLKRLLSSYGGLEKYTTALAQAFINEGKEVHLVCEKDLSTQALYPTTTLPAQRHQLFNYQRIRTFDLNCSQLFAREKNECLFFGLDRSSHQHLFRAGNGVHAYYFNQRVEESNPFKRFLLKANPLHSTLLDIEKKAFENPELQFLITNSHMVKQQVLNYYSIAPDKVKVVHNGVAWKDYQHSFDESFKDSQETRIPTLLFIGNGWERKGLKELLEALKQLANKNKAFKLLVLGKEKRANYYKNLSSELSLDRFVEFIGPCNNPLPYYQIADIAVIPSHYDPFANVTVEALAMGLLVVSSKTNGGHEILNSHNGLIVDDIHNSENFADTLESAIKYRKTKAKATEVRNSVKDLDFSLKLGEILKISKQVVL